MKNNYYELKELTIIKIENEELKERIKTLKDKIRELETKLLDSTFNQKSNSGSY
jgi:hypothetical protein